MTLAQLFDLAFGNIGRFFKEIAFKKRNAANFPMVLLAR